MADNLAPYTSVSLEPVTTDSRTIYKSGDLCEDVTLMHDGDALADVLWGVTSGKLPPNAAKLPRLVPVRFKLAPNSTIIAQASASGDRYVMVIATPLAEEASNEEELFNIRCLLAQLVAVAARLEIK